MAHANWMTLGLSPIPRPEAGIARDASNNPAPLVHNFTATGQELFWALSISQPRKIVKIGINIAQTSTRQHRLSLWPLNSGGEPIPGAPQLMSPPPDNLPVQTANFVPSAAGFQWFDLPANRQYTPSAASSWGLSWSKFNPGQARKCPMQSWILPARHFRWRF